MKYDIFLIYAREDASFAKAVAKGLERYNISVLYQQSLFGKESLSTAINEAFGSCLFGVVILSKNLLNKKFGDKDIDYVYAYAMLSEQVLHLVWYDIAELDVVNWSPKLADCLAIHVPPETPDSIARKFQMKLAGTPNLQEQTLTGYHPQIQYIPPTISTFRDPAGDHLHQQTTQVSLIKTSDSNDERGEESREDDMAEEIALSTSESINKRKNLDDIPIGRCFTLTTREQISKRLDVYLKDLSNWKDLAKKFRITDEKTLKGLLKSGTPTMRLLDLLAIREVTLGELKAACRSIYRNDVAEYIESRLANEEIVD